MAGQTVEVENWFDKHHKQKERNGSSSSSFKVSTVNINAILYCIAFYNIMVKFRFG